MAKFVTKTFQHYIGSVCKTKSSPYLRTKCISWDIKESLKDGELIILLGYEKSIESWQAEQFFYCKVYSPTAQRIGYIGPIHMNNENNINNVLELVL